MLRTTVYRVNACTFDVGSRALRASDALADLFLGRIAFNCKKYLDDYPEYQAFRAADLGDRLHFKLDEEVTEYARATLRLYGETSFIAAGHAHRADATESQLRHLFARHG